MLPALRRVWHRCQQARFGAVRCRSHVFVKDRRLQVATKGSGAMGPFCPIHAFRESTRALQFLPMPLDAAARRALARCCCCYCCCCCKLPARIASPSGPRFPDRGVKPGRSREARPGFWLGEIKKRRATAGLPCSHRRDVGLVGVSVSSPELLPRRGRSPRRAAQGVELGQASGHGISPLTGSHLDVADR